jgi:hypothetical protein
MKQHKGKVSQITFDLITPNMANISGSLPDDLRDFAKRTNSIQTAVSITADPASSLKIEKTDPAVNGLVDYSTSGGGDISIRLTGIKKKIHTSRSVKEVTIDEAVLSGTPDAVAEILKGLLP